MLLDLGPIGYGPAGNPTRRRVELFADWIEAQTYLLPAGLSKPDIVDRLEGTGLTADSDDAWRLVADAYLSCRRRKRQLGEAYPFSIAGDQIELFDGDRVAYRFCLMASLPEQLKQLRTSYPQDFRDLFEEVVVESLKRAMPKWSVFGTGWATAAEEGKNAIVKRVVDWTRARHFDETVFPNANDAQVDVAIVRQFRDKRSAFPVILGQCATGATDWRTKTSRPNLDRWTVAVQFSCLPLKMFAVPFALDDDSFWEASVESRGMVLDRARICEPLSELPRELEARLRGWLDGATALLPLAA